MQNYGITFFLFCSVIGHELWSDLHPSLNSRKKHNAVKWITHFTKHTVLGEELSEPFDSITGQTCQTLLVARDQSCTKFSRSFSSWSASSAWWGFGFVWRGQLLPLSLQPLLWDRFLPHGAFCAFRVSSAGCPLRKESSHSKIISGENSVLYYTSQQRA